MSDYKYLDVQQRGDATIVVHFGENRILDGCTTDRLKSELNAVAGLEACQYLVLDFSGVAHASSTMLQELVTLRRKMQLKGGRLALAHIDSCVRDVLVTTRLFQIFDIEDCEFDAFPVLA